MAFLYLSQIANFIVLYQNARPYYTNEFIKNSPKSSDEYIAFAKSFAEKDESDEDYKEIKKEMEKNDSDRVHALRGLDHDFVCNVKYDPKAGEPNQKWHFLVAYCALSKLNGTKENIFKGSITCPELWLWLIEAAQDDMIITNEDVESVFWRAIEYKKDLEAAKNRAETENAKNVWKTELNKYKEKIKTIIKPMYIVANRTLNTKIDNPYYLRLNRQAGCLEIYEKADTAALRENYPIRQDFDASDYTMHQLAKRMPCIFGGGGKTQTPAGIFNIEKVSSSEYISPYHPRFDLVKFFGYLVVFEDYFIHSDLYSMDANIDDFREKEPISLQDEHTSGCIRVSQDDLKWLVENIPAGTTIEM